MEMSSSRRYSAGGITHRSLNLVEPSVRELQPTHSKETPQQELKEEETPNDGFLRIAKLSKPELPAAVTGVIGSIGMGMIYPVFSLAFSSITAIFYYPVDQIASGVRTWSLVLMGVGFLSFVSAWIQSASFHYMGQKLARRVRVMVMAALLKQDVAFFDDDGNNSGILASKLSADALAVKGQFGDTMGLMTQNLVTFFAALIIAGVNSWRIMLVVVATLPILVIAQVIHSIVSLNVGNKEHEQFAAANALAAEAFFGARTVAALGMEDQVGALFSKSLVKPSKNAQKGALYGGVGYGFSQFASFSAFALAFWYMGVVISKGQSSFEQALTATMAIFMAAIGIAQAQLYFPDVSKGKAAASRVFALVDRKPEIDPSSPNGLRPTFCAGQVELRNINFAYPRRPDSVVFQNFSLTVPAGKTVALVGESGSGKSTVIALIERFYDPLQGSVLLDNVDIRTLNIQWLRSQLALVTQEPILFNLSVADNIRYGKPEASMEDVIAAAKVANAHMFIEELPEGYYTQLGEGAIQLSGGQKQRMAIARAVIKNARILLLDEATSALDAKSEQLVQDALDNLMAGRTTIVVAHRLSTIQAADSIAVVYKGKLIEEGTHDELLIADGAYARLVATQMK